MKRSGFLWVFIGFTFLMMTISFCLPLLTRLKSETLPLHIVSWPWPGKELYHLRVVDLDADGQDEIVFYHKGWWWAEWEGKPPTFQKIPIPTQATKGRMGYNIFVAYPNPYISPTPARSSPSAHPMIGAPSPPSTSRPIDIWLVTRAKEQWKVVSRQIHISTSRPESVFVFVGDWDRDGRANDVLFAVNDRVAEWWQRDEKGNIRLHAQINLPSKTFLDVPFPRTEGFSRFDGSWKLADIDGDGRFDKVDIDGDGKIDKVEVKIQRQGPKSTTMLSITLSSGCKFSLKFPYEMSFAVKDFDGDGQTEVFGWTCTSSDELHLYCWDFDPKKRCLDSIFQEKVQTPPEVFCSCCKPKPEFSESIWKVYGFEKPLIGELAFAQSKDGFQWLFAIALKNERKVIARWRFENNKWQRVEDIPLPNQSEFDLLWVGDGLLAFEKRRFGMASLVLVSIEDWLREMIAGLFGEIFNEHFHPTNLWVWKEGEGWSLLDRLTGVKVKIGVATTPEWFLCGDLDGDGLKEILVLESRSWRIGQWKDGKWRKSRPIEGYSKPVSIIRDGKKRWILCSAPQDRFIAVRIAE